MKKPTLKVAILLAGAAVLVPLMALAAEPTTGQKPSEADRSGKSQLKYLLHLPKDYDQKEAYNNPELYEWLLQQKRAK